MQNLDLRLRIENSGLRYRDVAQKMGIRGETLSRILRKPVNQKNWMRISLAITDLETEREDAKKKTLHDA